jgi:hypothetical protein
MKDVALYDIVVAGRLRPDTWADWFAGMTVSAAGDGSSLLRGYLDQPGLHGVLSKIRDLGLVLISVDRSSDQQGGI